MVVTTPAGVLHSTIPLLQRPARKRDYDRGPGELLVLWQILDNDLLYWGLYASFRVSVSCTTPCASCFQWRQ